MFTTFSILVFFLRLKKLFPRTNFYLFILLKAALVIVLYFLFIRIYVYTALLINYNAKIKYTDCNVIIIMLQLLQY